MFLMLQGDRVFVLQIFGKVYRKGTTSYKRYVKGVPFFKMVYKGFRPWGGAFPYKTLKSTTLQDYSS